MNAPGGLTKLRRWVARLIARDSAAKALKREIARARAAHRPVKHHQAALTALRHDQLRRAVG